MKTLLCLTLLGVVPVAQAGMPGEDRDYLTVECTRGFGLSGGLMPIGRTWEFNSPGVIRWAGSPAGLLSCEVAVQGVTIEAGLDGFPFYGHIYQDTFVRSLWFLAHVGPRLRLKHNRVGLDLLGNGAVFGLGLSFSHRFPPKDTGRTPGISLRVNALTGQVADLQATVLYTITRQAARQ